MARAKGDPKFNVVVLTVAGITGMLTGVALQDKPAVQAVAAAVVVGLAVGLVLLAVLRWIVRRRSGA